MVLENGIRNKFENQLKIERWATKEIKIKGNVVCNGGNLFFSSF